MQDCNLPLLPVETQLPDGLPLVEEAAMEQLCEGRRQATNYQQVLTQALCADAAIKLTSRTALPGDLLVLSGGSHNGSYGVGYLKGWGAEKGLPNFAVVTGISTGAVFSTAAFLGDWTTAAYKFGQINDERQLLKPYVRKKDGEITLGSVPAIIKHSAVADLAPLENWLVDYLTDDVLRRVAERHSQGARLLAGVVDAESGKAVAIDLTQLAKRFVEAGADTARQHDARICYAKAIVASSSAPLAAKPVFMDNRSYVDGGVRYGVFVDSLALSLDALAKSPQPQRVGATSERSHPRLYMIANGTVSVDPWCEKQWTKEECDRASDPLQKPRDPRKTWDLGGLGLRAIDLMVNQLQLFSISDIRQRYERAFGTTEGFHFTRITTRSLAYVHHIKEGKLDLAKSCTDWYHYDEVHLRPVQFHPHFMKCLIAAGEEQALIDKW